MPYILDIKGKRFGRLIAVKQIGTVKGRGFLWKCLCDCGNTHEAFTNTLTAGHCKSCGCLQKEAVAKTGRSKRIDVSGRRFGSLIATGEWSKDTNNRTIWKCLCDCGTTTKVDIANLMNGTTKSCGCLRKYSGVATRFQALPYGVAAFHSVLKNYKEGSQRRNYTWELTDEECRKLFCGNCIYCGSPPMNVRNSRTTPYVYSGIDRVDNTKGYTMDNCVSCCKTCNRAKDTMTVEEFTTWIRRVAKHLDNMEL